MVARIGKLFTVVFEKVMPDPFVLCILLTVLAFVGAIAEGTSAGRAAELWWFGTKGQGGFAGLFAFGMQMSLILVTGYVLAQAPSIHRLLTKIVGTIASGTSAAVTVAVTSILASYVNWGFGLIVGAVLAKEAMSHLSARKIPHSRSLIASAGYVGLMVWHGGLSGSGPLDLAAKGTDLTHTILLPMNLALNAALLIVVPVTYYFLAKNAAAEEFTSEATSATVESPPDSIWNSVTYFLIVLGGAAFVVDLISKKGLAGITINEVILIFLVLAVAFHRSINSFLESCRCAASASWGILLQFPFYGGIIGLLLGSGLSDDISRWFIDLSAQFGTLQKVAFAVAVFVSACTINLFIPSGGGQWKVQGALVLAAGSQLGFTDGQCCMLIAYGDELTNMIQPFWALPLLGITGTSAQRVLGYSAVIMLVSFPIYVAAIATFL